MIRRVMIDLETLGTKPGCVVCEIGVVCNFPEPDSESDEDWKLSIPFQIKVQQSSFVDPGTVFWWMQHPDAWASLCARQLSKECLTPYEACHKLKALLTKNSIDEIWANSPSFDCDILHDFMRLHLNMTADDFIWKYSIERDFRTARNMYPWVEYIPPRDAHGGLTDAIAQAAHLDKLGLWKS